MGPYLAKGLRELALPEIGEVRAWGLLIGLELVTDSSRTPMPEPKAIAAQRAIREAGVIVGRNNDTVPGYSNVLTISPPLTLTESEADTIIAAVKAGMPAVRGKI